MESLPNNTEYTIAIYRSPTVGAAHATIHVTKRTIHTFFVAGMKTLPKFASYSETKNEYAFIFSKRITQILNARTNMNFTPRTRSLQQPALIGGLRKDESGVAVEGRDPSFLGCAMSQRHR
jgi:hypothetical protein